MTMTHTQRVKKKKCGKRCKKKSETQTNNSKLFPVVVSSGLQSRHKIRPCTALMSLNLLLDSSDEDEGDEGVAHAKVDRSKLDELLRNSDESDDDDISSAIQNLRALNKKDQSATLDKKSLPISITQSSTTNGHPTASKFYDSQFEEMDEGNNHNEGPDLEWEDERDVNMIVPSTNLTAGERKMMSTSAKIRAKNQQNFYDSDGTPFSPVQSIRSITIEELHTAAAESSPNTGLSAVQESSSGGTADPLRPEDAFKGSAADDAPLEPYEQLLPGLYFVGIHRVEITSLHRAFQIAVRPDVSADLILDVVEQVRSSIFPLQMWIKRVCTAMI
jgi:hypothetical protein